MSKLRKKTVNSTSYTWVKYFLDFIDFGKVSRKEKFCFRP